MVVDVVVVDVVVVDVVVVDVVSTTIEYDSAGSLVRAPDASPRSLSGRQRETPSDGMLMKNPRQPGVAEHRSAHEAALSPTVAGAANAAPVKPVENRLGFALPSATPVNVSV